MKKPFRIYLTAREFDAIATRATIAGLTFNEYARGRLLGGASGEGRQGEAGEAGEAGAAGATGANGAGSAPGGGELFSLGDEDQKGDPKK